MVKFTVLSFISILLISVLSTIQLFDIRIIRQEINNSGIIKDNAKRIIIFTAQNTKITETKVKILSQFWKVVENIKV